MASVQKMAKEEAGKFITAGFAHRTFGSGNRQQQFLAPSREIGKGFAPRAAPNIGLEYPRQGLERSDFRACLDLRGRLRKLQPAGARQYDTLTDWPHPEVIHAGLDHQPLGAGQDTHLGIIMEA